MARKSEKSSLIFLRVNSSLPVLTGFFLHTTAFNTHLSFSKAGIYFNCISYVHVYTILLQSFLCKYCGLSFRAPEKSNVILVLCFVAPEKSNVILVFRFVLLPLSVCNGNS